jgi:hypothetical protein
VLRSATKVTRKVAARQDAKMAIAKSPGTGAPERPDVTADEVLQLFEAAGGKGSIPGIVGSERLAKEINEPFEGFFSPSRMREWAKAAATGPSAKLRKKLIGTAGPALEDFERSSALAKIPPLIPEYGGDLHLLYLRRAETMLALVKSIVAAVKSLDETEFSPPRMPRAQWHDDAVRLARVIRSIYTEAGRRRVSFSQPDAPAISVLVWALDKIGHEKEAEAVVQALRRSATKV